ncbi:MAG: ABC transporter ATP-binding protein, partial [Candidatus Hydrogenedentes bacterium]|nr:ABC transporter ATP-binding protein [Candidatus Hydrogenedentota bacterium]
MHDLGAETKYDTRNLAKPVTSAWRVYKRLIRYALHYKGRLAVALLFSVLTAASFGTMLATLGTTISILTWAPERPPIPAPDAAAVASDAAATTVSAPMDSTADLQDGATKPENVRKPRKDPAESIAEQIASITGGLHDKLGWAPEGLDTGFWNVVTAMRTDRMYAMKTITVIMILLAAISGFASFLQEYFAASIGANISVRLGEQMYENVIRSSLRFFEERHTGEIMARFTNDIFMVNRGLAGVFVKLMSEPIKAIVFLSIALSMNVGLTLVGLCVLPPVAIVVVQIGKKVKKSVRRSLEKVASMASVVNESVSGITIVKGFCMEDYEIGRLKTEIQKLRRYLLQMVKADAIVGPSTEFILITGVVLFALLSVSQILSGKLDAGNLTALSGALVAMMDPLRKISSVNNAIQASVASAERVFEFIDLKPDVVEATNAVDLPVIQKSLRFENVRFSYNATTEVLRGIDLEIKKGEMIAIVG